jgi:hypothetical protein
VVEKVEVLQRELGNAGVGGGEGDEGGEVTVKKEVDEEM